MDIVSLVLAILTSVGFIAAVITKAMRRRSEATLLSIFSFLLLDATLLLKVVQYQIKGVNGFTFLFLFIGSLFMTIYSFFK